MPTAPTGVRHGMLFPSRLLAALAALGLLAYVPGVFTRGDVLRGVVVAFLAAVAAVLGALLPSGTRPSGRRLLVALLPLLVPALGLIAGAGDAVQVLRLSAPWIALATLTVGASLVWFREEDADRTWRARLIAGAVAGIWVVVDALLRRGAGVGPFGRPGIAGPVLG